MGNILYQYEGYTLFSMQVILSTSVLVFFMVFSIVYSKYAAPKLFKAVRYKGTITPDFIKKSGIVLCIVFLGLLYVEQLGHYKMGNISTEVMKNEAYSVVEGYVENCQWMIKGREHESFSINGIDFKYSDDDEIEGYHYTRVNDGVITGDGQYLKIWYYEPGEYDESLNKYGNVILYIEELEHN